MLCDLVLGKDVLYVLYFVILSHILRFSLLFAEVLDFY